MPPVPSGELKAILDMMAKQGKLTIYVAIITTIMLVIGGFQIYLMLTQ